MAGAGNDYGNKGFFLGKAFIALLVLIILMIWVYGMNQEGLPKI